jgi:hypothetical protein
MSMQWPVDKLTLVNSALAVTGNNLVNVADDGSDEWNVCSPAYERGLALMMEDHGWGFATVVNPNLTASPTAPANTQWDTAYTLPSDLLHLIWVRINQAVTDLGSQTPYDIENGKLVLNARGGPPPPTTTVTPSTVSIKYVSTTYAAPDAGATPLFIVALQAFVMSGIYRGLHEDTAEADKMWQAGETLFAARAHPLRPAEAEARDLELAHHRGPPHPPSVAADAQRLGRRRNSRVMTDGGAEGQ